MAIKIKLGDLPREDSLGHYVVNEVTAWEDGSKDGSGTITICFLEGPLRGHEVEVDIEVV